MDWRTSHVEKHAGTHADRHLDAGHPGCGSLAIISSGSFPIEHDARSVSRVQLAASLVADLQAARDSHGRFDPMILATHPSYPNARTYVLKLHRDANTAAGDFVGRLENVTTGETFAFDSADELLACLARDVATTPL